MVSSAILDPEILEPAAQIMFKRLTFAEGVVEMPCLPSLLDEQMTLLQELLLALHQKPPQAEVDRWRQVIGQKLEEGSREETPHRLVFRYQPFDSRVGLTGGFSLGFSLKPLQSPPQQPIDLESVSPYERCRRLSVAYGEILFPCVPALLPQIVKLMQHNLGALGHTLSEQDIDGYHRLLEPRLNQWFAEDPGRRLLFRYAPLEPSLGLLGGVQIELTSELITIEHHYYLWTENRSGALFGQASDAKVMAVATEIAQDQGPQQVQILDVGAGTGRNTFPLARMGFQVKALELTQVFAQRMIEQSRVEGLALQIITGDFLDRGLPLTGQGYDLVFLSEVIATHFRSISQVRQALIRACELTRVGGQILFDIFLCVPEYEPTPMIRQMSLVYWTYLVTQTELHQILQDMPLQLISTESSRDFEQKHTPAEHWPPTNWYEKWATGRNLFPITSRPPLELQWILCRRLAGDVPTD